MKPNGDSTDGTDRHGSIRAHLRQSASIGVWLIGVGISSPSLAQDCSEAELLERIVPLTFNGETSAGASRAQGSCAGDGPERVFVYDPPISGLYRIDTVGSSFDTVLYVYGSRCSAALEVACNDDIETNVVAQSRLEATTLGDPLYIVVDGYDAAATGAFQLHIGDDVCPAGTALPPGSPQTIFGSTVDEGNGLRASCSPGVTGSDSLYFFAAPRRDTYTFDTYDSQIQTELSLRRPKCTEELACSLHDPTAGGAHTSLFLEAGEQVGVIVDGGALGAEGSFSLHISGSCPVATELADEIETSFVGSMSEALNSIAAECRSDVKAADGAERVFEYVAPADGRYTIDTLGSRFDTVLSVRDLRCDGRPLACDDDIEAGTQPSSSLRVDLDAGQRVAIIVDGYIERFAEAPTVQVNIGNYLACFGDCDDDQDITPDDIADLVSVALHPGAEPCADAADAFGNLRVSEIVRAVKASLLGC